MDQLPIFDELVAARAFEPRRDGSRHAWRQPRPSPRPRVKSPAGHVHEWAVPATLIRITAGDQLYVEADLGWHRRVQTYVHLYGVAAGSGGEAIAFIESVAPPGTAVTVVSHRMLEPHGEHPMVLASVTLPSGRDLSTLLLSRDLVKPGKVD